MSIRTLLPRCPTDPVWFVEKFLIDPETGEPFDLFDHEREFLRSQITDLDGTLNHFTIELTYKSTTFAAIYLITTLVLFRHAKPEVASAYCGRVNHVFEAIRRIVESSPLLRAEAEIAPDRIMIAGAVVSDHNQLYRHIEG